MTDGPNVQRTLVILKPDAVQRGISGEILARFERRGLRIASLRLLKVDRAMAEKHYEIHKGKFFYEVAGHRVRARGAERDRGRARDGRRDTAARGRAGDDPR